MNINIFENKYLKSQLLKTIEILLLFFGGVGDKFFFFWLV